MNIGGEQQNFSQTDMMLGELKGMSDMMNKIQRSCYEKCIHSVREDQLSVGEQSCSDRCVHKYMDVHTLVGSVYMELSQQGATGSS
jgi:import inner membrane translocase subunit TIM10